MPGELYAGLYLPHRSIVVQSCSTTGQIDLCAVVCAVLVQTVRSAFSETAPEDCKIL